MSDEEERDRRGRFERTRSPQRSRSRSRSRDRRSDGSGRTERPAPDDPPATLFVAELPPNLQVGALEKLCVEMPVGHAFILPHLHPDALRILADRVAIAAWCRDT